jgi:hypothetical protein
MRVSKLSEVAARYFKLGKGSPIEEKFISLRDIINEKGEINYEKLDKATAAIISGAATLTRLDPKEERGRIEGGSIHVGASLILGADKGSNPSKYVGSNHAIDVRQESLITSYALARGVWLDESGIINASSEVLPSGAESDVYLSEDKQFVIKITNYNAMGLRLDQFLDARITLHNYLFPDTSYEVLGFTKSSTDPFIGMQIVLKQAFIHGEQLYDARSESRTKSNIEDLVAYMKTSLDMDSEEPSNRVFANSNYVINDLHGRNVLRGADGCFYFIDPIPGLNTGRSGYGGVREYDGDELIYFDVEK